ncbi:DUF4236 domain-containing protein [bacterium]|nr:DUF4236 domain-containing protein [bacterium]
MSFYLRKSLRVGPLRFNLSKSGIGVSTGIPGLRVSKGPSGTYIHMGRDGLYYRKRLDLLDTPRGQEAQHSVSTRTHPEVYETPGSGTHGPMCFVGTSSIDGMIACSADSILKDIREKESQFDLWPLVLIISIAISFATVVASVPDAVKFAVPAMLSIGTIAIYFYDSLNRTVVLMYDLDEEMVDSYSTLCDAIGQVSKCKGAWVIRAKGEVYDGRYHAGASELLNRSRLSVACGDPPFVRSNLDAPKVELGNIVLHFYPDEILVRVDGKIGSIQYAELVINSNQTRFLEDETVPSDTRIIGRTWKYVNKNGSPDRRFRNNFEIPICLYEEIKIESSSGLREVIQLSRLGIAEKLKAASAKMVSAIREAKEAEEAKAIDKYDRYIEGDTETVEEDDGQQDGENEEIDAYEVLFDLICCFMVVDGKASTKEKEKVVFIMKKVASTWSESMSKSKIDGFIASVRLIGFPAIEERVFGRLHVFKTKKQREVVIRAINLVIQADSVSNSREIALLAKINKMFDDLEVQ